MMSVVHSFQEFEDTPSVLALLHILAFYWYTCDNGHSRRFRGIHNQVARIRGESRLGHLSRSNVDNPRKIRANIHGICSV